MTKKWMVLTLVLLLLAACGPVDQISEEDQVATLVAEALAEEEAPAEDEAAAAEEAAPEEGAEAVAVFGDCANSELASVAYVKDGDVWLWSEDGGQAQLTASGDVTEVQISEDGCRIAYKRTVPNPGFDTEVDMFSSETVQELWVVHSDGTGVQQLVSTDWLFALPMPEDFTSPTVYRFAFQPGSHLLAFNTRILSYGLYLFDDINLVDVDSGGLSTLRAPGEGGNFYFSPDGNQVAYSTPDSVSVINVDGSDLRENLISFPVVSTYSEYLYRPPVSWGPESDQLMVAVPPEEALGFTEDGVMPETTLWYAPLDGTEPWEAGSIQTEFFVLQEVQFAPDLGRIAYPRHVGELESNQHELVIALSNGSNESAQLQGERILFEAWAPDSESFIYSTGEGESVDLYLSDVDGNMTPLVNPTGFPTLVAEVVWATDSHYLLVQKDNESYELVWRGLDGVGVQIDVVNDFVAAYDVAP